jgi:hypothetical protein
LTPAHAQKYPKKWHANYFTGFHLPEDNAKTSMGNSFLSTDVRKIFFPNKEYSKQGYG